MSRGLALLTFFLAGAAWLGLTRLFADTRPALTVHVPADSSDAEVARWIDEAVLVEAGLGLGWKTDPLMRDRAARIGAESDIADPLGFADAVDLPRRDPLMRARLIERAQRAWPDPGEPTRAELEHLAATPRFVRPAAVTFEHRFTRDPNRAQALLADDRGEPELVLGPHPTRSATELTRDLGPDAAHQILAASRDTWTLVRSPLGHHAVRVTATRAAAPPPTDHILPELRAHWRAERRAALAQKAIETLRKRFAIEVVTLPRVASLSTPRAPTEGALSP